MKWKDEEKLLALKMYVAGVPHAAIAIALMEVHGTTRSPKSVCDMISRMKKDLTALEAMLNENGS